MLLRHLLSIALLPFVVVVLVPRWLLQHDPSPFDRELGVWAFAGATLFAAGITLFAWCVFLFARIGRGTLAPWDPTRRLVIVGPYRHVRNPMITSVLTMLLGEAVFARSTRLAWWALVVFAVNHAYFLLVEEPGLVARFGEEYERYRAAVPRWIPRLGGWP